MSPRARHFGRGMSGQHKDAGTDDAADSDRNEIERGQSSSQRANPAVAGLLCFLEQCCSRLPRKDVCQ
jgi:hypothetical protein